jgi:citrate synthase
MGRMATLQRHLAVSSRDEDLEGQVAQRPTKADEETRASPGGGAGSITIIDNRTGKKYDLKVSEGGTIRATDLKQITAGGDGVGLRTYDPGYVNTAACISRISYIDGDKGILRYRGYPIEELAAKSTYTEVSYLLQYGELPSRPELARWDEALRRHSALPVFVENAVAALPHDAHFMGTILTAINALSTGHPEQNPALAGQDIYKSKEIQDKQIVRLIGKMPAIAALAYHRASGRQFAQPNTELSYSENFLYMLDAGATRDYKPNPRLARAIDIMFTLHAEHEMNCSTAAARHLASSGVDVYTAVAGAIGALYGPLHGGANEAVLRMLERIGSVENIPAFLEGVKNKKEKMFGFGHRVYKNFDPRAAIIREVAEEVFEIQGRDPLIDVAIALEKAARADSYFKERKLYPNVDFYSGLVYKAMGFPTQYFTVLFAVPRVAGYLAHWRESLADPDTKIIRPQQDYKGVWFRHYQGMDSRPGPTETLGAVPPSNAYRRRAAGTMH